MDRNLTERLKKLSQALVEVRFKLETADLTTDEEDALLDQEEDIQDEIWDINEQLEAEANDEYAEHSAKGWN